MVVLSVTCRAFVPCSHIPQMFYRLDAQATLPNDFRVFRPIRTAHYALLRFLEGSEVPQPWIYHLANVCWHGGTAMMLFAVLTRLLPRLSAIVSPNPKRALLVFCCGAGLCRASGRFRGRLLGQVARRHSRRVFHARRAEGAIAAAGKPGAHTGAACSFSRWRSIPRNPPCRLRSCRSCSSRTLHRSGLEALSCIRAAALFYCGGALSGTPGTGHRAHQPDRADFRHLRTNVD